MKASFDYVPEMANSELYLDFKITKGEKDIYYSFCVKIADGVIATSELPTAASSNASYANDAFQRIIKDAQTANIMFLIQQANLRNSELNSDDMKEFHKKVAEINADTKNYKLNNIEISAYASPDGGVELNTGLAENRENNTEKLYAASVEERQNSMPTLMLNILHKTGKVSKNWFLNQLAGQRLDLACSFYVSGSRTKRS